ncbi:hypothetical protein BGZ57DRAFT_615147 [Hyaloscypha finlandica]|nr:hypothetical protein BGZ57DRAFT_615147 [Hyaloscypha finlandica]KAH8786739.1 hypothetical protein F5882DRAFT_439019 [Hyaloscypha sp. PMI_1271]
MQFPTILALLAAAATSVLAQDLSGLPTCAQTCFTDNFANSACAVTDIACLCADTTFFNDVEICVLTACSTDDAIATLTWATTECDAAGVPLSKKRSVFGRRH